VEYGVLADAADVAGFGRQALQDLGVGVTAVANDHQRPGRGQRLSQLRETGQGDDVEALLFALLLMLRVRRGGRGLRRLGRGGRVGEVDRNHPRLPVRAGPRGAELHEALAAHEIGLEGRPQGISFPADAVDLGPGFAHEGVIDGRHERNRRGQVRVNFVQHGAKQPGRIDAVL